MACSAPHYYRCYKHRGMKNEIMQVHYARASYAGAAALRTAKDNTVWRGLRAHARSRMHPQTHTRCADPRRLCGLLARVRMRMLVSGGC